MPKTGGARPGAGRPRRPRDLVSNGPIHDEHPTKTMGKLGRLVSVQDSLPGAAIVDGELVMPKGWMLPLVYMAGIINNPAVDPLRRDRIAGMMAPYVHSKRAEAGVTAKQKVEDQAKRAGDGTEWAGILRTAA